MKYQQAFRYSLDRQGGFVNLLLLVVCQLIPVVGGIVVLGYMAEVSVALNRDPELRRHPKFVFDRFVEYLTRGVWPFLISLILTLPLFPIMGGALIAGLLIDPPGPNNPPIFAFAFFWAVTVFAAMLASIVTIPMMFHAEMTGKFDFRGAVRFTLAFLKKVGGLAIITGIVYFFLGWIISIVGLLCCFVGIYLANAVIQMASIHLMVQLYREYLNRGGEPLAEHDPEKQEDEYEEDPADDSE